MKTLMLLSAVPGSGKSTWAEQFKLLHKHVLIVSSDGIRRELTGKIQDFNHEEEVWKIYFNRIIEYRDKYDDVTVIADSTNIYNKFRLLYPQQIPGFDKKVLVMFRKPLEKTLELNKLRGKDRIVPEEAVRRMYENFEEPNEEVIETYDEIITVHKWFDMGVVKDEFHYK